MLLWRPPALRVLKGIVANTAMGVLCAFSGAPVGEGE
jgi:hypothetical protein